MYKFSESTMAFYPEGFNGEVPADAVDVSTSLRNAVIEGLSTGYGLGADKSGRPVLIEIPKQSIDDLLTVVKGGLRNMRAPMLDALTGIAGRAVRAGNETLAAEADALAEQLLDITDDAALNAATTYEAMQDAGMAAYRRIASGASAELAAVFKEITGA